MDAFTVPVGTAPGEYSISVDAALVNGNPPSVVGKGLITVTHVGQVPPTMTLAKSGADITFSWSASCGEGADNYAIYEGILGSWYSHDPLVCEDSGAPLEETVGPGPGDLYYLLVPRNDNEEGSYGSDSIGAPRPAGASPCVTPRVLAPCPP